MCFKCHVGVRTISIRARSQNAISDSRIWSMSLLVGAMNNKAEDNQFNRPQRSHTSSFASSDLNRIVTY